MRITPAIGACLALCAAAAAAALWMMAGTGGGSGGGESPGVPNEGRPTRSRSAAAPGAAAGEARGLRARILAADTGERRRALLRELLAPSPERFEPVGVSELFEQWFADRPLEALEAVAMIEGPLAGWGGRLRKDALRAGIPAFLGNPRTLDEAAERLLRNPDGRGWLEDFRRSLHQALGRANPEEGYDMLRGLSKEEGQERLLLLLCEGWVRTNPRAAATAMLAMAGGAELESKIYSESLYGAVANARDVEWALREQLPAEVVGPFAAASARAAIAERGMAGFVKEADTYAASRVAADAAMSAAVGADAAGFVDHLDELRHKGLFDLEQDAPALMHRLASQDQESSERFLRVLDAHPQAQAQAAAVLAGKLLRKDANLCANWAASLPSGPVRDAALAPLLDYLRRHNETESLTRWSALLSRAPDAGGNDSP